MRVARECGNWGLRPIWTPRGVGAIFSSEAVSATEFPGMSLSGISLSGISLSGISGHRLYMSITGLPAFVPCSILNYDKIIRAIDIFVMPDLAARRTAAIQVDGVRVRFRMTGT